MPAPRQAAVQIDTALIPEHIRFDLLSIIHDETVVFFQQPGVAERFERWKAEKEKRAAEAARERK